MSNMQRVIAYYAIPALNSLDFHTPLQMSGSKSFDRTIEDSFMNKSFVSNVTGQIFIHKFPSHAIARPNRKNGGKSRAHHVGQQVKAHIAKYAEPSSDLFNAAQ
ncbi:hypothetical protein SCOCK_490003 [Actinacidiphila cocklensis]|uniref:Uncharacterized protein n=1 Tax=Actinacidiphila cocklensis TaxID=887465 RepID=A0A9W4DV49_9ACTN|nr:hypothetical protein SCOCK_490003 [Actinacidiphila cocklensis]